VARWGRASQGCSKAFLLSGRLGRASHSTALSGWWENLHAKRESHLLRLSPTSFAPPASLARGWASLTQAFASLRPGLRHVAPLGQGARVYSKAFLRSGRLGRASHSRGYPGWSDESTRSGSRISFGHRLRRLRLPLRCFGVVDPTPGNAASAAPTSLLPGATGSVTPLGSAGNSLPANLFWVGVLTRDFASLRPGLRHLAPLGQGEPRLFQGFPPFRQARQGVALQGPFDGAWPSGCLGRAHTSRPRRLVGFTV